MPNIHVFTCSFYMYCPATCAELKPFWSSLEANIQDGTGKLEAALASHHYLLSVWVVCSPKCFSEFDFQSGYKATKTTS